MVKFELFGRTQIFSSEVPESLTVGASLTYTDFFYWQLAFCSNFKGKHCAPTPPTSSQYQRLTQKQPLRSIYRFKDFLIFNQLSIN